MRHALGGILVRVLIQAERLAGAIQMIEGAIVNGFANLAFGDQAVNVHRLQVSAITGRNGGRARDPVSTPPARTMHDCHDLDHIAKPVDD